MKARLVTFTAHPLALIYYAYHHEKHGVPYPQHMDTDRWPLSVEQCSEAITLLLEGWGPFLELPTTVWELRLPRSLHAQFRVHRHISAWSQSHQLFEPSDFRDDSDYWMPEFDSKNHHDNDALRRMYDGAMHDAQRNYRALRKFVLPSIARQVLPQAINLGLTVGISLRSLAQLAINRRCHIFQGTMWNPLLDEMRAEVMRKMDSELGVIFDLQPCDLNRRCLSHVEQRQRQQGEDPHATCPRWREMQRSEGRSTCCEEGCDGCLKHAVEKGVQVKRSTKE